MTSTLHDVFDEIARANASRVAVIEPLGQTTYRELAERANRVAEALVRAGVGPQSLVGLCIDRSVDLIVGIIAILKAGGAYVPIDPEYPADRIAMLLADSDPVIVVTVDRIADCLSPSGVRTLCIGPHDPVIRESNGFVPRESHASDLAYVIYTSGSTGRPKGVQVEHRNVVRLFEATQQFFKFQSTDVWTLLHSCSFDFSVWEIFGALLHGGTLVIVPTEVIRSPQRLYALLDEHGVTVLNVTPSAFRGLAAEDARAPRDLKLRAVVFGGEALDLRMLDTWFARHGDEHPCMVNMYGITETTVHTTYRLITKDDVALAGASPIGAPLADLTINVCDEAGVPLPDGYEGELYIAGPGVARGYLNRPDLTAERFVSRDGVRFYRSGDRGRLLPNGELHYLGRVDDQLKVRGYRIEPREVETLLAQDTRVSSVVVVARDYGEGDVRLVAVVVPDASFDLGGESADQLARDLAERAARGLPDQMRPSYIRVVASLPITPHGKVDREALSRPQERDAVDAANQNDSHANNAIATIEAIWRDVLDVHEVGLSDDFFDLGGTSLAVIRMLGRVNNAFGVVLDPSVLLEEATVECLARAVQDASPTLLLEGEPC